MNTAATAATAVRQIQKPPSRMALKNVVRGRIDKPVRVLIHGTEGVGKSTFASAAPSPMFICAEDGTAQLDIERFPEPRSFAEVLEAIDVLVHDEHDHKTLVLDTIDWLEPLIWEHVCREGKKSSIEDFGYGKGYVAALDQWRVLVARLDALRAARSMHVILIAHSWIKAFANPEGDSFDRYEIKVHKGAAGLLKEWSDAVLFATYEQATVKDGTKTKGVSTGARIMRTERRAAFDAKNRFSLPFEMPLSWDEFWAGVKLAQPAKPEQLTARARELAAVAGVAEKVEAAIVRASGDAAKLAQLLDWVQGRVQLSANGEQ